MQAEFGMTRNTVAVLHNPKKC